MGGAFTKEASDRTASKVASIRHIETIMPLEGAQQKLFDDPYAAQFYFGSSIVAMMPMQWLMQNMASDRDIGIMYLLVGRTREFDEQMCAGVAAGIKQIVILGAGYDTRGFRLSLPDDVSVFEVDQPDVQKKKQAGLDAIKDSGVELPNQKNVHFVPCDFNVETVEKLGDVPGYDPCVATLITMEGVTQYIPKEATAGTLKAASRVSGSGSRVVISYVPQEVWDTPDKVLPALDPDEARVQIQDFLDRVEAQGEPWISSWTQEDFAAFMSENGYAVQRDASIQELVEDYYVPASRDVPEAQRTMFERYVLATKK